MHADDVFRAEIARRCRQRFVGVYLCLGFAALLAAGVAYATRLMHGEGYSVASATIVALGTGSSGEPTFTSEFRDAAGVVHRDTQPYGYHYARGEPKVGQRVRYLYQVKPVTGTFDAFPGADVLLHWFFGVPAVLMTLSGALLAWLILRERGFRLRLLREGRREKLEQPSIRPRTMVIPAGANSQTVHTWRLEGRYFDPAHGEYVECHGDWEATATPELRTDTALPPLFVDPANTSGYWLPSGELAVRRPS